MVQWLRICLPVQGTRVGSLVWEDPTCGRTTKPVCHNYWACALEPTCYNYWSPCTTTTELMHRNYWAHARQLLKSTRSRGLRATTTEPACCNYWSLRAWSPCPARREATAMRSLFTAMKSSPCSPQLEKACTQQWTRNTAKKKKGGILKKKELPPFYDF